MMAKEAMLNLPFGYYVALERASESMLDAALAGQWDRVIELEDECGAFMEKLQTSNCPACLTVEQRSERLRIFKSIVRHDAHIRNLAQPWVHKLEDLMSATHKAHLLPEIDNGQLGSLSISNSLEILAQMRVIRSQKSMVSIFPMATSDDCFDLHLIEIDTTIGRMHFEAPTAEQFEALSEASESAVALALIDQVKVQFKLAMPTLAQFKGHQVLSVAIPKNIIRIQRRDAYRVRPLASEPAHCLVAPLSLPRHFEELTILDISVGGLSFEVTAATEHWADLEVLSELKGCFIQLPGQTAFPCNLRVRYVEAIRTTTSESQMRRIGVDFNHLNAAEQRVIQIYINSVDGSRRAIKLACS